MRDREIEISRQEKVASTMNSYDIFNLVEGLIWLGIALLIPYRVPCHNKQQKMAIFMGGLAFLIFGVTDFLEIGCDGQLPLWLWLVKIACGSLILGSRYTWLGWNRFRWSDREFLFGLGCLAAVLVIFWFTQTQKVRIVGHSHRYVIGSRGDC